ncbi:MAG: beta-ketoacyl-[acyl-carrier-protein] synthase family protein [Bacteroidales bacterium]|nr:beta-ketoacyl-[acyl-carrier-protein] synthase family protein [Bacteroidales bacterium]
MNRRVVITGMGILSPIGNSLSEFLKSLQEGNCGLQHIQVLAEIGFGCQLGGIVNINQSPYYSYLEQFLLTDASNVVKYAVVASLEAWENAGLPIPETPENNPDTETGIIIGSAIGTVDIYEQKILPAVHQKSLRRLRSTIVEHSMLSAPSANLAGILGLANWIGFNSSACSTGSEAIAMGYRHIKHGYAKRMIVGGVDIFSPAAWAGFDAMRVTTRNHNHEPQKASRPMSATASGFVPAEGCGILVLEEYETAMNRNAPIYAEIAGAWINSGGQRNGGTMTAPSSEGVVSCIEAALKDANVEKTEVQAISGHLSSTMADVLEIRNWKAALNSNDNNFPFINSLKSMIGHTIGAAGAIETIAAVLELKHQFLHPSLNCEDVHPEIQNLINCEKIVQQTKKNLSLHCIAKSSFGFGDTNTVIILKSI